LRRKANSKKEGGGKRVAKVGGVAKGGEPGNFKLRGLESGSTDQWKRKKMRGGEKEPDEERKGVGKKTRPFSDFSSEGGSNGAVCQLLEGENYQGKNHQIIKRTVKEVGESTEIGGRRKKQDARAGQEKKKVDMSFRGGGKKSPTIRGLKDRSKHETGEPATPQIQGKRGRKRKTGRLSMWCAERITRLQAGGKMKKNKGPWRKGNNRQKRIGNPGEF